MTNTSTLNNSEQPTRRLARRGLALAVTSALAVSACGGSSDGAGAADGAAADQLAAAGASSGQGGWADGASVEWFDHSWTFSPLQDITPEDAAGTARTIETTVTVRNPLTDVSYSIPMGWLSLRSVAGERFDVQDATTVSDGTYGFSIEAPTEGREEYVVQFEVPDDVSIDDLLIELGAPPNRTVTIGENDVVGSTQRVPVSFGTTRWEGDFGNNGAIIEISNGSAGLSSGTYADGRSRPEPWLEDRQADEDQVFVQFDMSFTEYSTSAVSGAALWDSRVVADGAAYACTDDSPGLIAAETVQFSVTCPVPVDATTLTYEIGTDPCVGGCTEFGWTSEIDTSFLAEFRQS